MRCLAECSLPDASPLQHTLIRAYGENHTLRGLANLVIFAGNRDR